MERKVILAENAGFCFGANRGYKAVEDSINDDIPIYTFGPILNNTKIEWQMNSPEVKNLYGINYSIDSVKDNIVLDKGLYSLDGYCVINDDSLILDEHDTFMEREIGSKDIYLFLYNNDFEGCLSDYFSLTGYPNLIPRYALGTWWYKNNDYSEKDIIAKAVGTGRTVFFF